MDGKPVERDTLTIGAEPQQTETAPPRNTAPSVAEGGTPVEGSKLSAEQLEQIRDEKATWTPVEEKPAVGDRVRVTLVRPASGTTNVEYFPIQP